MRLSYLFSLLVLGTNAVSAQEKPQPLPAVPVTAKTELVRSAKLREFDRRRSMGIGRFITEAELEKDQHRQLSDVLKRLPGTMMVRARGLQGVSPMAVFVVSSRGSATIQHESPVFGKNCPVAIWLDGVPVYRGLDRQSGPSPAFPSRSPAAPGQVPETPFDINSIMTQHIAAIEFYAGPATMPPELNATQGTCGALVIWTK
jgi:TonB-dependent receptor-like protein